MIFWKATKKEMLARKAVSLIYSLCFCFAGVKRINLGSVVLPVGSSMGYAACSCNSVKKKVVVLTRNKPWRGKRNNNCSGHPQEENGESWKYLGSYVMSHEGNPSMWQNCMPGSVSAVLLQIKVALGELPSPYNPQHTQIPIWSKSSSKVIGMVRLFIRLWLVGDCSTFLEVSFEIKKTNT